ncbi:hypothetical protein VTO73DRAFT_3610 [Trametes versicolor]
MASQVTRSGRTTKPTLKIIEGDDETHRNSQQVPSKRKKGKENKEPSLSKQVLRKNNEFKITPLPNNSTSNKGQNINLTARAAPLPLPKSAPVLKTAGQRRNVATENGNQTPKRKLSAEKAAALAAMRAPYGKIPTSRRRPSPRQPSPGPSAPRKAAHGHSESPQNDRSHAQVVFASQAKNRSLKPFKSGPQAGPVDHHRAPVHQDRHQADKHTRRGPSQVRYQSQNRPNSQTARGKKRAISTLQEHDMYQPDQDDLRLHHGTEMQGDDVPGRWSPFADAHLADEVDLEEGENHTQEQDVFNSRPYDWYGDSQHDVAHDDYPMGNDHDNESAQGEARYDDEDADYPDGEDDDADADSNHPEDDQSDVRYRSRAEDSAGEGGDEGSGEDRSDEEEEEEEEAEDRDHQDGRNEDRARKHDEQRRRDLRRVFNDDQSSSSDETDDEPLAKRRRTVDSRDRPSEAAPRKACRIRKSRPKRRPCAADYEPEAQEIFGLAIPIYKSYVSSQDAYPDKMTELVWARQAWDDAGERLETELSPNREVIKIISAYSWHLRGELKTAARPLVEATYGFRASQKTRVQLRNRERATKLREADAFVYRKRGNTADDHQGLYEAEIIQQVANRVYFKKRGDDGIVLKEIYSPFPDVALALIIAAIECCIDEWSDGTYNKISFTEASYRSVYEHHLRELRAFEHASEELQIVTEICKTMYQEGRVYAKAGPDMANAGRSLGGRTYAKGIAQFKARAGRVGQSDSESDGERFASA